MKTAEREREERKKRKLEGKGDKDNVHIRTQRENRCIKTTRVKEMLTSKEHLRDYRRERDMK